MRTSYKYGPEDNEDCDCDCVEDVYCEDYDDYGGGNDDDDDAERRGRRRRVRIIRREEALLVKNQQLTFGVSNVMSTNGHWMHQRQTVDF